MSCRRRGSHGTGSRAGQWGVFQRPVNVTAGGSIRLSECDEVPGTGWVQEPPDLTLEFRNNAKKRMLRFKLVGEKGCDTALLVNDTEADWQYSDDDDGLNPVIR